MPRNVEIKARVADAGAIRERLRTLGADGPELLEQTDTFFVVPQGRLKVRQFANGGGELIYYERPDVTGPSESLYATALCADPAALTDLLGRALGVRGIVRKRREVFLVGQTRVHLDEVEGLGTFLELEVVLGASESVASGRQAAVELMGKLHLNEAALLPVAYIDLLEATNVSLEDV